MTTDRPERRNAVAYLVGLGLSLLGDNAMSLVAGIWIKTLTGSSAAAALASVCVYAPVLLGPLGGAIADRYRLKPLLTGINLTAAAVVLAMVLVRSRDDVWLIYAAMFGYGCAMTLTGPAESALFARIFTPETRERLNGASLALQEAGRLVAPLAGAGLFALAGGGAVAALDAGTFAVAAGATALVRYAQPRPARRPFDWRADLTSGLRRLGRIRELRLAVVLSGTAIGMSGVAVAAQYSLVAALHRPPGFLGVLSALLGAGSVAGGLLAGPMIRRVGERRLILLGVLDLALGSGLRATGALVPALLGSVVLGFALPWCLVATITLTQRLVPLESQGRASAAVGLLLFAPQPLTQAAGAGLVTAVDYRLVFVLVAVVPLAVAAAALRPVHRTGPAAGGQPGPGSV
ncbi:Major Facilitator Superfamily protein [Actinacidiphila yanglinensis]|uniref:Major Facilitator Superfamily protein n=1 Tax=Actinacidiphila yanglinensis TaxID=310779 RepID=A0A1H6CJR8_9ACTN|nr:MFS transporter [Actinacidiphila yanglinensis]SEG73224.1 Major Facilitator Superfamily protein [Actinacidiphila yanglinensis]